jgi:hypothetical protein
MKNRLSTDIIEIVKKYVSDQEDDLYTYEYVGIIEDNNDPLKIGRCRTRIHGIYDGISTNELPWAVPDFPLAVGVKGSFIVPEIGTVVAVYFDNGDRYEPRFRAKILDTANLNFECDKDEDYPNSVIFYETSNGDYFKINRAKGELIIKTGAGALLRMSEDGTIELNNMASEKGDLKVKLRGNISIDNRQANTNIITTDLQLDLFGDMNIISNGGSEQKYLDDYNIKTNRDINLVSSKTTYIKSKDLIKTESIEQQILSNKTKISPATNKLATKDTNGISSPISPTFSYSFPTELEVATMSVTPSIFGGPFNCIPFDPLTGMPHQGRILTGTPINSININNALEVVREVKRIKDKYAKIISTQTNEIISKYASIDSQAQLLLSGPGSSTLLLDKKTKEIQTIVEQNTELMLAEIEEVNNTIVNFFDGPVFGNILETSPEKDRNDYNTSISQATIESNLDLTGKTIYKDIIGAGKGLVNDD